MARQKARTHKESKEPPKGAPASRADRYRSIKKEVKIDGRTDGQKDYLSMIEDMDITICNGLAGTGKTLIAVGAALSLMSRFPEKYKRLIMVRPHVLVPGEDMGYLPGDIDEKMKPFVAPMFDSLDYFLNKGEIASFVETGTIDVIPIAYMRGRTFNNSIIIFDEAQNSRWEHMKMFLTRIGFNTKAIIEGDVTQSDLPKETRDNNGLLVAAQRLGDVEGIGVINLEKTDVVRSPIVKRILSAIED